MDLRIKAGLVSVAMALVLFLGGAVYPSAVEDVERHVSEDTWTKGDWPVTVDRGTFICDKSPQGRPAVWFEAPNGKIYPLNGVANSIADMRLKPHQKKLHPVLCQNSALLK